MTDDYELIYSLTDTTFRPSLGFIIASQIGLILFFAMLLSFVDLKSHLKTRTRLFLLGISVFGLLQFGSLFSEYKTYQADHDAVIGQSSKVIVGRMSDYKQNNRGYKTFVINGIQIETGESFSGEIRKA